MGNFLKHPLLVPIVSLTTLALVVAGALGAWKTTDTDPKPQDDIPFERLRLRNCRSAANFATPIWGRFKLYGDNGSQVHPQSGWDETAFANIAQGQTREYSPTPKPNNISKIEVQIKGSTGGNWSNTYTFAYYTPTATDCRVKTAELLCEASGADGAGSSIADLWMKFKQKSAPAASIDKGYVDVDLGN